MRHTETCGQASPPGIMLFACHRRLGVSEVIGTFASTLGGFSAEGPVHPDSAQQSNHQPHVILRLRVAKPRDLTTASTTRIVNRILERVDPNYPLMNGTVDWCKWHVELPERPTTTQTCHPL
jgi:hypothetical protein